MAHQRWKLAKRVLTGLFLVAVIVLLVFYAAKIDWPEVWQAISHVDPWRLAAALALVVLSYLIYGCYDLLARLWCRHRLRKRQVMMVSFVCYAFNLTLSTWVGGIGMRYRLYSRLGLPGATITRIFSMSIATNWLGYILTGGMLFVSGLVTLPPHWYITGTSLRILGGVLLAVIMVYLWACAFAKRRHVTVRGQKLILPSWRFALVQMAISSLNWCTMGATIWLLMGMKVDFLFILGTLLVSSIAGVIVHIPAGIGVTEAVFVALLRGGPLSNGAIIAALLIWRALYFFLPLLIATVVWLWLESRAKHLREKNQSLPANGAEQVK